MVFMEAKYRPADEFQDFGDEGLVVQYPDHRLFLNVLGFLN